MNIARGIWASLIVAVLGLPIILTLLQSVPNIHDFEMAEPSGGKPTFVALGDTANGDGSRTARKALWQTAPDSLLGHDEVRLLVVTYGANLSLIGAELRVAGGECVYQTPPRSAIVNTGLLTFRRAAACDAIDGNDHRELDLAITYRGNGRIGLAAYFVPASMSDPKWLTLTASDPADPRPIAVARGRYVDNLDGAPMQRVALLARMWGIADSPSWIWIIIAAALAAVWLGAMFVTVPAAPAPWWPAALSSGAFALALALLYAVLVPPLQAPDEPDHVLAFAQLTRRPALAEQLATFARDSHFDRIHFRPDERFRAVDVGTPFSRSWDASEVFAHDVTGRSSTTAVWWRSLAPLLAGLDASRTILGLRLANGVIFAISFGLASALLLWTSRTVGAVPHVACLALFLIPTLPFFATHVSEFALLVSAYIVLAAAIAALFMDGERVHLLGLPIGIAASCVLAGGRSGLPYGATLAAAIAGRALLGSRLTTDVRDSARRSVIFWGGLAIGLALFPMLSTAAFRDGLWPADSLQLPPWFRSAAELLRRHPAYVAALIPVGLGVELVLAALRRRLPPAGRIVKLAVTTFSIALLLAIAGSLVASLFISLPTLTVVETARAGSAGVYALEVVRVAATSLRVSHHDWLLSSSFWGGFGWLETALSERLITVPILLAAMASIALLVNLARTGRGRGAMWLGTFSLGWLGTLAVYAVSNYFLGRNLHGRYLIGLYLSILALIWSSLAIPARMPQAATSTLRPPPRELAIVLVAGALHACALSTILLRYF